MVALRISKLLVLLGVAAYSAGLVKAQSTTFTYQGQLKENGLPANGSYDLEFKLFDAAEDGLQVGPTLTSNGVSVTNGLFEQTLDFGTGAFTGQPRWLEVMGNEALLSPRQPVTATPYAMKTRGIFVNDVGNVGIGTNDTSHRLTIEAPDQETMRLMRSGVGFGFGARLNFGDADYVYIEEDVDDKLQIQASRIALTGGNVGIGTTTPDYPLTIRTIDFASGYGWIQANGTVELGSYLNSTSGWLGTRTNHPLHFFTNDSSALMTLTTAGGLGIGTLTVPAGVRLAVKGKVLCEEMEVQLSGDWPDYVFDESYSLMPLSELESTIKKHKHLPGIPPASELAKDGLNVGKMQAQLVEKVEELTLYMIQMNKQLERVERENAELKARLAVLEANP